MEKADRYISDARHYLSKGDVETALSSVSYAHGLIDGFAGSGSVSLDEVLRPVLARFFVQGLEAKIRGMQGPSSIMDQLSTLLEEHLVERGLVERAGHTKRLTPAGRNMITVGLAAGVFDILHPGHLLFLQWCKRQVDALCVIVARDHTTLRRKGRVPIQREKSRLRIIAGLGIVDFACLGDESDRYSPVSKIDPDLIFLGRDQEEDEEVLRRDLLSRGLEAKVLRSPVWDDGELSKTTRILEKIRDPSLRGDVRNS